MTSLGFDIKQRPNNRRIFRMMQTMEERVCAIMSHYPVDLAKEILPMIQSAAPRDIPRYAQSLKAVRFDVPGLVGAAGTGAGVAGTGLASPVPCSPSGVRAKGSSGP